MKLLPSHIEDINEYIFDSATKPTRIILNRLLKHPEKAILYINHKNVKISMICERIINRKPIGYVSWKKRVTKQIG